MAAPEKLRDVLYYHALPERLSVAEARKRGKTETVLGLDVQFKTEGDRILVNEAEITESDVECTNGVLHFIDQVLLPPGFKFPQPEPSTGPEDDAASEPAPDEQSDDAPVGDASWLRPVTLFKNLSAAAGSASCHIIDGWRETLGVGRQDPHFNAYRLAMEAE
jgi:hypothetical protein